MTLETLAPAADLDTDAFDESVLAALAAAGVPDDRIEAYPVTKGPNGKEGELVDEYGIELIPTVVVESPDGEEVARFVEDEDVSIAE